MKVYYRILHSNLGYLPQATKTPEDEKSWGDLAARPKFEYNEALLLIGASKASFSAPVVIYEEEFDNGVDQKVQDMSEPGQSETGAA